MYVCRWSGTNVSHPVFCIFVRSWNTEPCEFPAGSSASSCGGSFSSKGSKLFVGKKDEERLFFFAGWLVCLCEGGVVVAPPKSPPPCRFMWNYTPSDVNGGNATFIITRLRNLLTVAACYLLLASCCSSSPSDTADSNSGSFHASSIRVGKIIQKCCGN